MPAPEADAVRAAIAPPRALGLARERVVVRQHPEDFLVEEDLGFEPSGSGAHLLLKVRKTDANTPWVARELARVGGCRPSEVGYAGLKDRRAVAIQWFSLPRPRTALDWPGVQGEGWQVLEVHAHARKLPRGALAGNRFAIRVRPEDADGRRLAASLGASLALIAERGVPNYFGPQRFGRDCANLARAGEDLARLGRAERGFALSAARSLVFNAVLGERVLTGGWELLEAGDLANLEGRGSIFTVTAADAVLADRCRLLTIHPTGPLWGAGEPPTGAGVQALETRVAARFSHYCAACAGAGMTQERRSLRLRVHELCCESEPAAAVLRFRLARGGFATAVLRELVETEPMSDDG